MKIHLDKIETSKKLNGLGLKRSLDVTHYDEMYLDTDLNCYVIIRKPEGSDAKYSGKILVERSAVGCSQVSEVSIPKHQPIGTKPSHDTPSGQRKKGSVEKAKTELAKRSEARAASKKSAD